MALANGYANAPRAVALGVAAAVIWMVLDGIAPFGRRRARNAVSAQALGAVAIVLSVSWNLTGFGLPPVAAVTASALAAVISALALAAARRLGFRSSSASVSSSSGAASWPTHSSRHSSVRDAARSSA